LAVQLDEEFDRAVAGYFWAPGHGARCPTAECEHEIPSLTFMGPAIIDETDPQVIVPGELGRLAVAEHRSRREACRRWEAAS